MDVAKIRINKLSTKLKPMFFILEIFVLAIFLLSLQARNKNDTEEQPLCHNVYILCIEIE